MPFFASLWAQGKRFEFANQVADSVSRVACLGLLGASAMVSLGLPVVDLIFVGGRFSAGDARECAAYFAVFSVSMFLWSGQAIYARAFYAAGNTFAPMAAGTVITVISLPVYAALFRWHGAMGLAIASDIGIALQTGTIAVLLHEKRMVSLASLDYVELGRCAVAALTSGAVVWAIFSGLLQFVWRGLGRDLAATSRWVDLAILLAGMGLWLTLTRWVLEKAGSMLPQVAMKRLRLG
jgi:putative peptidoglycan lipid II flippase